MSFPNWLCLALFLGSWSLSAGTSGCAGPSARGCCLLRSHPSSPRTRHPPGIRHLASAIHHLPLATRHSSGGALWTRVVQFPGLPVPFRANLGHPFQRGPSFSCGKKDRQQRVTTERPHPTGGSCPREGHGKAGLIRILFAVRVGEFRGWSLIPRDPRLDVAGRNPLSGFVRILVAAVIVCVPASGIASPPMSRPRRPGIEAMRGR